MFSSPFTVSNGVKQGRVLSPILFCIYIDSLLYSQAEPGVGCFIGRLFVGALVYADDIVLLSPTASGMRMLLHLCDVFANDFQSFLTLLKLSACGSKPDKILLHIIRTPVAF